jgi:hypothetical protein
MNWQRPDFVEIKMSSEIGSYQEDGGGRDPIAEARGADYASAAAEPVEPTAP